MVSALSSTQMSSELVIVSIPMVGVRKSTSKIVRIVRHVKWVKKMVIGCNEGNRRTKKDEEKTMVKSAYFMVE